MASSCSDDDAVAVVDLVLDDLGGPAGEGSETGLEFFVLPLDLDGLIALRFPAAGEGETALLRLVGAGALDDDGVEHDVIFAVVVKDDDALADADHVGGHAHAAVPVGGQGVQQVLGHAQVLRRGGLGFLGQEKFVFADIADHSASSWGAFFFW